MAAAAVHPPAWLPSSAQSHVRLHTGHGYVGAVSASLSTAEVTASHHGPGSKHDRRVGAAGCVLIAECPAQEVMLGGSVRRRAKVAMVPGRATEMYVMSLNKDRSPERIACGIGMPFAVRVVARVISANTVATGACGRGASWNSTLVFGSSTTCMQSIMCCKMEGAM